MRYSVHIDGFQLSLNDGKFSLVDPSQAKDVEFFTSDEIQEYIDTWNQTNTEIVRMRLTPQRPVFERYQRKPLDIPAKIGLWMLTITLLVFGVWVLSGEAANWFFSNAHGGRIGR